MINESTIPFWSRTLKAVQEIVRRCHNATLQSFPRNIPLHLSPFCFLLLFFHIYFFCKYSIKLGEALGAEEPVLSLPKGGANGEVGRF